MVSRARLGGACRHDPPTLRYNLSNLLNVLDRNQVNYIVRDIKATLQYRNEIFRSVKTLERSSSEMQFDARIRFMDTKLGCRSTPKHYVRISTHDVRVKRYDYRKNPTENNLSDVTRFSRDIQW